LVLLCRGHHHAVHEGGWRFARHPDGTITAIRPTDDDPPPHKRRAGSRVDDGDLGRRWTTRFTRTRHRWRSTLTVDR
jgi:hypothetical protein